MVTAAATDTGTDGDDMAAIGATAGAAAEKSVGADAVVLRDSGNKGAAETNPP
jgi:hypothetical protein